MKQASELGLSEAELAALIRTQGRLQRGDITKYDAGQNAPMMLDMGTGYEKYSCGSVGCIAGWMAWDLAGGLRSEQERVLAHVARLFGSEHRGLHALFFPRKAQKRLSFITSDEAAEAIGNFLVTGDPKWDEVTQKDEVEPSA